jgi:hypothetical protein
MTRSGCALQSDRVPIAGGASPWPSSEGIREAPLLRVCVGAIQSDELTNHRNKTSALINLYGSQLKIAGEAMRFGRRENICLDKFKSQRAY